MRPDRIVLRIARERLGHARGFGGVAQRFFSAVTTRAVCDAGWRVRGAGAVVRSIHQDLTLRDLRHDGHVPGSPQTVS